MLCRTSGSVWTSGEPGDRRPRQKLKQDNKHIANDDSRHRPRGRTRRPGHGRLRRLHAGRRRSPGQDPEGRTSTRPTARIQCRRHATRPCWRARRSCCSSRCCSPTPPVWLSSNRSWSRRVSISAFRGVLDSPPSDHLPNPEPRRLSRNQPVPLLKLPDIHPLLKAAGYLPYDVGVMGELDVRMTAELFGGEPLRARACSGVGGRHLLRRAAQKRDGRTEGNHRIARTSL